MDPEVIAGKAAELQTLLDENPGFAGSGDVQDAVVSLKQGESRLRDAIQSSEHAEQERIGSREGAAAETEADTA